MARDTLDTLIRLAGSEVDDARRALQAVLAEEDTLRAEIDALKRAVEHETEAAKNNPEFAGGIGAYLARAKGQRETLSKAMAELRPRIEAARDALAEAFANQKKYEIAMENRDAADVAEDKRRDGIALDEIGLNSHRREE